MEHITRTHVAQNVALAAAGWAGVSTLRSDHIRGIVGMAVATHNTCAACGEALSGALDVCHIVGAAHGKGFVPFNAYVGHKACNDYDRESCQGDAFRVVATMVRRDLVLASIPARAEALAYSGHDDKARRAAKRDSAPAW